MRSVHLYCTPVLYTAGYPGAGQLPDGGQQVLSPRPGLHDPLQVINSVGPVPSDFQVDKWITLSQFTYILIFSLYCTGTD